MKKTVYLHPWYVLNISLENKKSKTFAAAVPGYRFNNGGLRLACGGESTDDLPSWYAWWLYVERITHPNVIVCKKYRHNGTLFHVLCKRHTKHPLKITIGSECLYHCLE
jgi:hypothetical protein